MSGDNITIHVKDNETIDRALKRFKKKFEQIGVLKKLRARMYYKKTFYTTQRRAAQSHLQAKDATPSLAPGGTWLSS